MRRLAFVLAVVAGAAMLSAQAPEQSAVAFEVASIRPVRAGAPLPSNIVPIPRALPGGAFGASFASVVDLLWFAYNLRQDRIIGGPDWAREERFAIDARAGREVPVDQLKLMVRSLLEERFALVAHMEPREMRLQALIRARPNGPLGPALLPIDECTPAAVGELRRKSPEKYPTPAGGGMMSGCSSNGVNVLADYLTLMLGDSYIDATGLQGSFYHTIRAQWPARAVTGLGRPANDPDLPALSTALEEQLGLKIESRRGPVEVLVIDSVERPTAN